MCRLPPGPNVGTQLRARRAAKTRALRAEQAERDAVQRKLRGPQQLALPTPDAWFAAQGWTAVSVPARGLGARRRGPLRPAACDHRLRQDLRGLARPRCSARCSAEGRRGAARCACCGSRRCARSPPTPCARCERPLPALAPAWRSARAPATPARAERARQTARLPDGAGHHARSLSLLLDARRRARPFSTLRPVVVDEWHELLGSKRGVQVQLALARLRQLAARRCVVVGPVGHAAATCDEAHAQRCSARRRPAPA